MSLGVTTHCDTLVFSYWVLADCRYEASSRGVVPALTSGQALGIGEPRCNSEVYTDYIK
jgi:hypothetical protein